MARAHGKSITQARNAELRTLVQGILDKDFAGNRSAAARACGITPTALSDFLNQRRGAGNIMLEAIAAHTKRSVDELMGRTPPVRLPLPRNALGKREDWPALRAEVERRYGSRIVPDILDDVAAQTFGRHLEVITPENIKHWHDELVEIYARSPEAKTAARSV